MKWIINWFLFAHRFGMKFNLVISWWAQMKTELLWKLYVQSAVKTANCLFIKILGPFRIYNHVIADFMLQNQNAALHLHPHLHARNVNSKEMRWMLVRRKLKNTKNDWMEWKVKNWNPFFFLLNFIYFFCLISLADHVVLGKGEQNLNIENAVAEKKWHEILAEKGKTVFNFSAICLTFYFSCNVF